MADCCYRSSIMGFERLDCLEGLVQETKGTIGSANIDMVGTGSDTADTTLLTLVNQGRGSGRWATGSTSRFDLSASASLIGATSKNRNAFHCDCQYPVQEQGKADSPMSRPCCQAMSSQAMHACNDAVRGGSAPPSPPRLAWRFVDRGT